MSHNDVHIIMSIQVLFFLICSGKLLPKHIQDDYIDYDGHHFDVACFDPSSIAALVLQIAAGASSTVLVRTSSNVARWIKTNTKDTVDTAIWHLDEFAHSKKIYVMMRYMMCFTVGPTSYSSRDLIGAASCPTLNSSVQVAPAFPSIQNSTDSISNVFRLFSVFADCCRSM